MPKRNILKPCLQEAATRYLPSCAALREEVGIITLLLETKLTLLVRDEGSSRPCFTVEDRFPISPRWAHHPCSFHCVILIGWSRKQGDSMASSLMGLGFKNTNTNKRANNQIPGEMMHVCKNCVKMLNSTGAQALEHSWKYQYSAVWRMVAEKERESTAWRWCW